jgi:hypothetical protein
MRRLASAATSWRRSEGGAGTVFAFFVPVAWLADVMGQMVA